MQSSILRGNVHTHTHTQPNDSSALASTRLRFCLIIHAPETYSTYKIHFPSPLNSHASSLALNIYNGHSRDNSGVHNEGELLERESKGNFELIYSKSGRIFVWKIWKWNVPSTYREEWNFYTECLVVLMISTGSNKEE